MKKKRIIALSVAATLMAAPMSVYAQDYVVQKGDNLYQIAKKYDTDWKTLASFNKLSNPELIYPGQVIKIPEAVTKPAEEPTDKSEYTKPAEKPTDKSEYTKPAEKPVENTDDKLVRTTKYGDVQGYEQNDNLIWTGVPYGKAPVGDLRWKEPQEPDNWDGVYDATEPTVDALQFANGEVLGTEDALKLDIYRPDNDQTDLPVLVYIHGGNNQSGTTREISGETLAQEANAVVVSVNYRLGLLGFNPLPAIDNGTPEENSGNFALLDIAAALDWVDENIEAFGGNNDNITLSGFSAGGRDVTAIMMSPIFEDKFDKAISFSGGITIADEEASINNVAKALAPLVVEDGVKATEEEAYEWLKTDGEDVRDYLYSVSSDRLVSVMTNAGIRMSVFPHLYNDGVVLPENYEEAEYYNDVPLMLVTGVGEFSFFGSYAPYFMTEEFKAKPVEEQNAELEFMKTYGGLLYKYSNAQATAEVMESELDSDIYITEIEMGEGFEEWGAMDQFGAFHGVFVPFIDLQNTSYLVGFNEAYTSAGGQELGEDFRAYIKNYLWYGDPNGEGLVEWEPWEDTANGRQSLVLGGSMEDGVIELKDVSIDYDEVLKQMEADTSISEEAKDHIISEVLNGRWFSDGLDEYFGNESLWVE